MLRNILYHGRLFVISLLIVLIFESFAFSPWPSIEKTPGHSVQAADASSLITFSNGKLAYTRFANEGETNAVNTIPDFSNSGYMGGGVRLPIVPVKKIISPLPGDNLVQIQTSIDEVSKLPLDQNGFRGAVSLKAGTYKVSAELFIRASGVVLRGEGQGSKGTILVDLLNKQNNFLTVGGDAKSLSEN